MSNIAILVMTPAQQKEAQAAFPNALTWDVPATHLKKGEIYSLDPFFARSRVVILLTDAFQFIRLPAETLVLMHWQCGAAVTPGEYRQIEDMAHPMPPSVPQNPKS